MAAYVRPTIDAPVFRDSNGQAIDYGNRWSGMPPEDTYSVDTHPIRFAPLHTVADALIAFVTSTFVVDVVEDLNVAQELLHERDDVIRAVRVTPALPSAAALTFIYTSYPCVVLRAGQLSEDVYPDCGCDACDESWDETADRLEELVLAVADGRFCERVGRGRKPWVEAGYTTADGSQSGRSESTDLPPERVRSAQAALARLPDGWASWPRRDQSS